jgi:hypothetical protein
MEQELSYPTSEAAKTNTKLFIEAMAIDKSKHLPASSPMTVSFYDQVKACVARQYQILWGDKATFIIKQGSTLFQALVSFCLCLRARLLLIFTL